MVALGYNEDLRLRICERSILGCRKSTSNGCACKIVLSKTRCPAESEAK
jgi:hypothetical protein